MGQLLRQEKYRTMLLGLGLLCSALSLVVWPETSMSAMRDGLNLCGII